MEVTKELQRFADSKYRDFIAKLVPTVMKDRIIGVRSKNIRIIVKQILNNNCHVDFINSLPHKYYEENIIHAALLSNSKDNFIDTCEKIEEFFPNIDNWAVCDTLSPEIFVKTTSELIVKVKKWILAGPWESRFALNMLTRHFLQDNYSKEILQIACSVTTGEYYVDMGLAWFLSYALIYQYEDTIEILKSRILTKSVQKKTIQKAIDSYRISSEKKIFLKSLR
ncbi:MAG: DNA alkylation repair protein [Bacilli bacterium]|nr:DNA alkylation repair protein [Bacilli bacterium]